MARDYVGASISSLQDFKDENLARSVLEVISDIEDLKPTKVYNFYLPGSKKQFTIEKSLEMWMSSQLIKFDSLNTRHEEIHLILENKIVDYQISWKRKDGNHFNAILISIKSEYLNSVANISKFLNIFQQIALLTNPVMARVFDMNVKFLEAINLTVIHPDLVWYNVFGEPYIKLFGKEKLLSTPGFMVEELSGNLIAIQLQDNIFTSINDEIKAESEKSPG